MVRETLFGETPLVEPIKRVVPAVRNTFQLAQGGRQFGPKEYARTDTTRLSGQVRERELTFQPTPWRR